MVLRSLLIVVLSSIAAQPGGLKIVVIAGEDAVNVIQQKTAVSPIVEVRDRNNQPVPGAVVTFTVQGADADGDDQRGRARRGECAQSAQ